MKEYQGRNIQLSGFRGKYVLLDFWASWCVPCLKQMPGLKQLLDKYQNKGFEVIAISIDAHIEQWLEAITKHEIQAFHHVLANDDIKSKYSNTVQPIPSQILINRNGTIIWNSVNGLLDLRTVLEREFRE